MKSISFLTFIGLLLLFSACEDETINNMEDINDQWTETNAENQELMEHIQQIMFKYNAHSYQYTGPENGEGQGVVVLLDARKKPIKGVPNQDLNRMASALTSLRIIQKNMAQLQDVDEIFTVVEEQPKPKNGMGPYFQYIAQNLKYPEQARKMGIEGKVYVEFVVNDFGEITDVKVLKGIGAGCDEAAKKVVENSAPWQPGRQKGQAVKVRMVLPITFKLDNEAS
ncbi:energy transducer TonB [Fulvivirgaceae bacterium BMA12]|uniref:Energy transducer TonB n=1 Tax=Agaribacillus aureus TaxID=3051825 RepID=A0ABT8KZX3_9BACT|nr:energy transducer TonB [Fulvivirgaceae bacterium BMA12]